MAYESQYTTADATTAGTDLVVGVLVGAAGFATLIGLALGIGFLAKMVKKPATQV